MSFPAGRIFNYLLYSGAYRFSSHCAFIIKYEQIAQFGNINKKLLNRKSLYTTNKIMANTIATYEEVKTASDKEDVLLIDVREPSELKETGTIPGSVNIPVGDVECALKLTADEFKEKYGRDKPEKNFPMIVYCKLGRRGAKAQEIAQKLGYMNVKNYEGAWTDWASRR